MSQKERSRSPIAVGVRGTDHIKGGQKGDGAVVSSRQAIQTRFKEGGATGLKKMIRPGVSGALINITYGDRGRSGTVG